MTTMKLVPAEDSDEVHNPHGCIKCFEVNKGYMETEDGHHVCLSCGGTVLVGLQEAFDYIAMLKIGQEED